MYENFSFKTDEVLRHLSNNTNEDNIRRYKEFEAKLKAEGLNSLDQYVAKHNSSQKTMNNTNRTMSNGNITLSDVSLNIQEFESYEDY